MNNRNVSKKREKIHAFMFKVLKCNRQIDLFVTTFTLIF